MYELLTLLPPQTYQGDITLPAFFFLIFCSYVLFSLPHMFNPVPTPSLFPSVSAMSCFLQLSTPPPPPFLLCSPVSLFLIYFINEQMNPLV